MIISTLLLNTSLYAADLEPALLTQVWLTAFDQDVSEQSDPAGYGDPEDDQGFKLRRARVGFSGSDGDFHYGLVFGMSSGADGLAYSDGTVGIVDAFGGWSLHSDLTVLGGVQKVPFGRESLLSSGELVFQERAVTSNHLAPGRELGLLAKSTAFGADIQLGVFNGNGAITGDDNDGLMYAVRLGYNVGEASSERTFGVVDSLLLSVAGNAFYDQGAATNTLAYGGDILLRWSGLAILAEVHLATIEPGETSVDVPDVSTSTQRFGAIAQAGWTFGQWEPAVRVELFDDDQSMDDNGDIMKITAGITGHFAEDTVRAGLSYDHREEMGGQALANDTARLFFQMRY